MTFDLRSMLDFGRDLDLNRAYLCDLHSLFVPLVSEN